MLRKSNIKKILKLKLVKIPSRREEISKTCDVFAILIFRVPLIYLKIIIKIESSQIKTPNEFDGNSSPGNTYACKNQQRIIKGSMNVFKKSASLNINNENNKDDYESDHSQSPQMNISSATKSNQKNSPFHRYQSMEKKQLEAQNNNNVENNITQKSQIQNNNSNNIPEDAVKFQKEFIQKEQNNSLNQIKENKDSKQQQQQSPQNYIKTQSQNIQQQQNDALSKCESGSVVNTEPPDEDDTEEEEFMDEEQRKKSLFTTHGSFKKLQEGLTHENHLIRYVKKFNLGSDFEELMKAIESALILIRNIIKKSYKFSNLQELKEEIQDVFIEELTNSGAAALILNSKTQELFKIPQSQAGRFVIAFNPLDVTRLQDVQINCGLTFLIMKKLSSAYKPAQKTDFFQNGEKVDCAGFCLFNRQTTLVYHAGFRVNTYILQPNSKKDQEESLQQQIKERKKKKDEEGEQQEEEKKEEGEEENEEGQDEEEEDEEEDEKITNINKDFNFRLKFNNIKTPKRKGIISYNGSQIDLYDKNLKIFLRRKIKTATDMDQFYLRYTGSIITDFYRTLLFGGVFLIPLNKWAIERKEQYQSSSNNSSVNATPRDYNQQDTLKQNIGNNNNNQQQQQQLKNSGSQNSFNSEEQQEDDGEIQDEKGGLNIFDAYIFSYLIEKAWERSSSGADGSLLYQKIQALDQIVPLYLGVGSEVQELENLYLEIRRQNSVFEALKRKN